MARQYLVTEVREGQSVPAPVATGMTRTSKAGVALLTVGLLLVLHGCGGGSGDQTPTGRPSASTTATAQP